MEPDDQRATVDGRDEVEAAGAADLARSRKLAGGAVDQDQDEQQATRGRMEAELEGGATPAAGAVPTPQLVT
jgi:hypothetical protein